MYYHQYYYLVPLEQVLTFELLAAINVHEVDLQSLVITVQFGKNHRMQRGHQNVPSRQIDQQEVLITYRELEHRYQPVTPPRLLLSHIR